jgi:hypothetical protein
MNSKILLISTFLFFHFNINAQSFLKNQHFTAFQFKEKKDTFQYIVSDTEVFNDVVKWLFGK